jgi:spore coat protein U-like protein
MSNLTATRVWPSLTQVLRFTPWLLACAIMLPTQSMAACSLSTLSPVAFGTYDVFRTTPLDSTGAVVYRCGNADHNITITLDKGGASSYTGRSLLNGTEPLFYNLYLDAARTVIWGDGSGGSQVFFIKNPQSNNTDLSIAIYGRIPPRQSVLTGDYTDSITVTMTF